jgi:hypothetical protein
MAKMITVLARILQSDDFGMSERGGNGRAFAKDGKLVVQRPFYYRHDADLGATVADWAADGRLATHFRQTYGVAFAITATRTVEDKRRFPGCNGYHEVVLALA